MYYVEYLISLCQRRNWAEPVYDSMQTRQGWISRVRVNNREYTSDEPSESERLSRDRAAESAYNICFNFSVNDGMYPGQRAGQAGIVQGLPVAIGTGRGRTSGGSKHHRQATDRRRYTEYVGPSAYEGSVGSRDSSPRTSESDLELSYKGRRSSSSSTGSPGTHVCLCGRGYVMKHSRCAYCLHEMATY